MDIIDAKVRRLNAPRPVVASIKPPPIGKSEYLYGDIDEDIDEQIAIARQKIESHRKRLGFVPIGMQVDLERLLEEKRISNDPNFNENGRN